MRRSKNAVGHLSAEADSVVRRTASTVFLSTALMQMVGLMAHRPLHPNSNGRAVARIYVQRPSSSRVGALYATSLEQLSSRAVLNPADCAKWSRRCSSVARTQRRNSGGGISAPGEMRVQWRGERVSRCAWAKLPGATAN